MAGLSVSCATPAPPAPEEDHSRDLGLLWVKHAAEYEALTRQAYQSAERHLQGFIEDTSWSALPRQTDAADLPPAVILDVDETVVSNVNFQLNFEPPFENWKLDKWNNENKATVVPGVVSFVDKARAAGVTVFFVTNRPCEPDGQFPCTQRQTTIQDIAEVGIATDANHVLLSNERGWNREKSTRRAHIAENYRVIMLFGDDLGDSSRACAGNRTRHVPIPRLPKVAAAIPANTRISGARAGMCCPIPCMARGPAHTKGVCCETALRHVTP